MAGFLFVYNAMVWEDRNIQHIDHTNGQTDMKIKTMITSIVFGLVFSANAAAKERINLEAEPEEKFKSCDIYGPGFVYIPGTQTCIKISGSVRATVTIPAGK